MRHSIRRTAFAGLAASLFIVPPAYAQVASLGVSDHVKPGQSGFYLGGSLGVSVLFMPEFTFGNTAGGGPPPIRSVDAGTDGPAIGPSIGLAIGKVWERAGIGRNFRTELSAYWSFATDSDESNFANAPGNVHGTVSLDGKLGYFAGAVETFTFKTKARYDNWGVDLPVKSDIGGGKGFRLTASIAPSYMALRQDYDVKARSASAFGNADLDETVVSHYFGALAGIELVARSGKFWFGGQLSGGAYYGISDYDGKMQNQVSSKASDQISGFAGRAQGRIGAGYDLDKVRIELALSGDYISSVPMIVHPSRTGVRPAHLKNDDAFIGNARINVVVPLGR